MQVCPPVLWAQRNDRILLTIDLQDVKDAKVQLSETTVSFSGSVGPKHYKIELELFKEINPKESRYGVLDRGIQMNLIKKESGPYWPRLLKEEGKHWFLKGDWGRWVDEDEQDEAGDASDFNLGDLDMGGGDYDDDADDDEMPGLEEDQPNNDAQASEN